MTSEDPAYDVAEHETFGFVDDEQPNEEGLADAILDADDYQGAGKHGMTPSEERQGTPLAEQLAAESPETADRDAPSPDESDPLRPLPDEPADPNDPDPVSPEPPPGPQESDPAEPESGEPTEYDPFRPLPDEPVPPRP